MNRPQMWPWSSTTKVERGRAMTAAYEDGKKDESASAEVAAHLRRGFRRGSGEEAAALAAELAAEDGDACAGSDAHADSLAASSPAELTSLLLDARLSVRAVGPFLQKLVGEVRAAVDAAVAKDPSLLPSAEFGSDLRLVRFLGESKWDAAAASAEYIKALGLRKQHGIDALRGAAVAHNATFFEDSAADLTSIYLHEKSRALQEVIPRMFTDPGNPDGPFRLLLDRKGNLVVIECLGVINYAAIAAVGLAEWEQEVLAFIELRVLVLDELSRRSGILKQVCNVLDMAHVSLLPNLFASRVEKDHKKRAAAILDVAKEVYPTTTLKTYVVNLPEMAVRAAGTSAAKLQMFLFASEFKAALLEDVAPTNLPQRLGGALSDGIQWANTVDQKCKKK